MWALELNKDKLDKHYLPIAKHKYAPNQKALRREWIDNFKTTRFGHTYILGK